MRLLSLCITALIVSLLTSICEAKDKLDLLDTINTAPNCYVLSEFSSYFDRSWKDDLDAIYTNYNNASRFMQFISMKAKKISEARPEVVSNTTAIMFNRAATAKRKMFVDMAVSMKGDSGRISRMLEEIYDEMNCSRFSKAISMDEYSIDDEISSIKSMTALP